MLSYRYKKERSVAFKIRQNLFPAGGYAPDPAEGAHDAPPAPDLLVGWNSVRATALHRLRCMVCQPL